MRFIVFAISLVSVSNFGCAHNAAKAEPPAAVAPSAQKAATTAAPAEKKAEVAASSTKVQCSVKGDERTLEVRDTGKGCELAYTKAGKEGIVANALHGQDYCNKAMTRLEEKLKGAGYTCQ